MNNDIIPLIFSSLVLGGSFFTVNYSSNKKNNRKKFSDINYKLYKTHVHSSAFKYSILPRRTYEQIFKMKKISDDKIPTELRDIFNKFVDYIDPINLEHCLTNIRTIKVQDKCNFKAWLNSITNGTVGLYNRHNNIIKLYIKDKSTLSHEFLHMASASRKKPYSSGFSIYKVDRAKKWYLFGNGLNEGYTELLNSRIFKTKENDSSYTQIVKIAKLIECFFDNYRDMEYAYFHNDLDAVYNAFCKYGTKEEYISLMNKLDCFDKMPMTSDVLYSLKIQLNLYEIIKRSKDEEKIKKFEKVLNSNLNGSFYMMKELNSTQKQLSKQFKQYRLDLLNSK